MEVFYFYSEQQSIYLQQDSDPAHAQLFALQKWIYYTADLQRLIF